MKTSYILYLPVEIRNQETGEPTGTHTLVQYELTETEYAFKATELEIHVIDCGDADAETVGYALRNHYNGENGRAEVITEMTFQAKRETPGPQKWADYIGQTVNARFAVERNIDGADVPVSLDRVVHVMQNDDGSILLNCEEWDELYTPFDEHFNLLK
jgi:hypothetical protein